MATGCAYSPNGWSAGVLRRRFDIDDDRVVGINQIVGRVEIDPLASSCSTICLPEARSDSSGSATQMQHDISKMGETLG
jgi:hypothetical protein